MTKNNKIVNPHIMDNPNQYDFKSDKIINSFNTKDKRIYFET